MQQEWAAADEGPYPRREDAKRRAMAELGLLCRGLEELSAIDPRGFDDASLAMARRRLREEDVDLDDDF